MFNKDYQRSVKSDKYILESLAHTERAVGRELALTGETNMNLKSECIRNEIS